MTAEVAILNKAAVALAADSAVTISSGSSQQKIFDSADKLFELSTSVPVAVMVNGDMNFSQALLPVLIKDFRGKIAGDFRTVVEASKEFLSFLTKFGVSSPQQVKADYLERLLRPLFVRLQERVRDAVLERIMDPDRNKEEPLPKWEDEKEAATNLQLKVMEYALGRLADAEVIEIGDDLDQQIFDAVFDDLKEEVLPDLDEEQVSVLSSIANLALVKQFGPSETGVVVAGFGSEEIFPTLVHYTIFGIVGNKLKYATHDVIDIDRVGVRAKVLPFAQKEMVERFLYGLDQGIRSDIARFCEKSLPSIRENLLDQLVIDPIDKDALEGQAKAAEKAFLDGLVSESFDSIRRESEAEIDEMVEFMPSQSWLEWRRRWLT